MNNPLATLRPFLNQPYPFYYRSGWFFRVLLGLLVFSILFNYLIEPFDVNRSEHRMDFFWICVIHSLFPVLIAFLYTRTLSLWAQTDTWTLGKELTQWMIILLLIGVTNFLLRDLIYDNPFNWSVGYLWEEVRNAYLVGLLIVAFLLPLNHSRLERKHGDQAKKLTLFTHTPDSNLTTVPIRTQAKGEDFDLTLDTLLFIKSEGNYSLFVWTKEESVVRQLKRVALKEVEDQLAACPCVVRTHRSYLVNREKVRKVEGNAQGFLLTLEGLPDKVPVSRSWVEHFNRSMIA